jgi:hypothetical protein
VNQRLPYRRLGYPSRKLWAHRLFIRRFEERWAAAAGSFSVAGAYDSAGAEQAHGSSLSQTRFSSSTCIPTLS